MVQMGGSHRVRGGRIWNLVRIVVLRHGWTLRLNGPFRVFLRGWRMWRTIRRRHARPVLRWTRWLVVGGHATTIVHGFDF